MYDHQRRRQFRRRDSGLAQIGAWTRRSIAAGVVLAAGLAAWAAHAFPGQAASSPSTQTSQTSPAPTASAQSREPAVPDDGETLAPPAQPPAPAQGGSHVTSGGS
ncbi:MAG TPA: hypothetical protein VH912_14195 [Streptosporangiaceae bacterium]|jgi:hypothetical protein